MQFRLKLSGLAVSLQACRRWRAHQGNRNTEKFFVESHNTQRSLTRVHATSRKQSVGVCWMDMCLRLPPYVCVCSKWVVEGRGMDLNAVRGVPMLRTQAGMMPLQSRATPTCLSMARTAQRRSLSRSAYGPVIAMPNADHSFSASFTTAIAKFGPKRGLGYGASSVTQCTQGQARNRSVWLAIVHHCEQKHKHGRC